MKEETIKRFWRIAYYKELTEGEPSRWLECVERDFEWSAVKVFWRFYWITRVKKQKNN